MNRPSSPRTPPSATSRADRSMNYRWIDVPRVVDERGTLSFVEAERQVPFPVRRMYALVDVPATVLRGGHAHVALEQCFVAIKGSLTLSMTDGTDSAVVRMEGSSRMLYMGPMVWHELYEFSADAACVVLASDYFSEADYIRDRDAFARRAHGQR
jgi:dTDP-4-dehydrorhamnose 3,5-epimerase-like enzyme